MDSHVDSCHFECARYRIVGEFENMEMIFDPRDTRPPARLMRYRQAGLERRYYYQPDPARLEKAKALYCRLKAVAQRLGGMAYLFLDPKNGECILGIFDLTELDFGDTYGTEKDEFVDLLSEVDYFSIAAVNDAVLDLTMWLEAYYELPLGKRPRPVNE